MPAKYVVSKRRGGFGVVLKAANGKQIADLGTMKDKRAVNNAIAALAKNAPTTAIEGLEELPRRKTITSKTAAPKPAVSKTATTERKAAASTAKSAGGTTSRSAKRTPAKAAKAPTTAKTTTKRTTTASSPAKPAKTTTAVAATS